MRFLLVSAIFLLATLVCAPSRAQIFGLGLPSPQVQPAHINPINAPSVPNLQSLPGIGRSTQDTQWKAPTAVPTGPGGLAAPAQILGGAPIITFSTVAEAKSVLPTIVDQPLALSGAILAAAPIINAPTAEAQAAPAKAPEAPSLADNALTILSLPMIGLDVNAPTTLAPGLLALQVNAPASLAPGSIALQSDRPTLLVLPTLALPVSDMMGGSVTPTLRRR